MTAVQPTSHLRSVVLTKKVVVCCGAGGVGKTSTAAALAIASARMGRRVLVLTIDPAKRLAQALGIPDDAPSPVEVTLSNLPAGGSLHAWVLRPGVVFRDMIFRLAPSSAVAEQVTSTRLFSQLSELVAGMQEYAAAEALHDFRSREQYDLIILDTPPSRNALDFLEAPGRLLKFIDDKIVAMFMPVKHRLGFLRRATDFVGTVFSKIFGAATFVEIQHFLGALGQVFPSMRAHASEVRALLESSDTAFLLISSPETLAVAEAVDFRERLKQLRLPFTGFVLNQSWAVGAPPRDAATFLDDQSLSPELREALSQLEPHAAYERNRRERDAGAFARLREIFPDAEVATQGPYTPQSIDSIAQLVHLSELILQTAG